MELTNLGDLIVRNQDLHKLALIDLGGECGPREYTYAQLDELINSVARGLVRAGYQVGDRIAILAANRAENLAVYYGIMRAGMVAVPINYKFPKSMIEFIVADSDAKIVFCDNARKSELPIGLPHISFDTLGEYGFEEFIDKGLFATIHPIKNQIAMFLYTSGSSGKPKGVMLSHESHIWVAKTRIGDKDLSRHRFLIAAPLYHMNALALAKMACLAHSTIILLPEFNTKTYISAVKKYQVTWLTAVPPMIAMMLHDQAAMSESDFSSVEILRMGSAPVSASLMLAIAKAMPHVQIMNAYGTTEGGPVVFAPHAAGIPLPNLSVGVANPAVEVRLNNQGNIHADSGILEMRSPGLLSGYHKAQSRTPPLKNPFSEDGFYITGDVFRRDQEGFYYFIGRSDDMFVCGGENIYPSQIEKLLESHPDVEQAAVVGIDDDIKGQKPVAFVVKKISSLVTDQDLKIYTLSNAPAYQHPRHIWFVDALPLATTNKIDKVKLLEFALKNISKN